MKLNEKSQIALRFGGLSGSIARSHEEMIRLYPVSDERKDQAMSDIRELFSGKGNRNYLMSESSLEIAKRIRLDYDKFDVKFLSDVKEKKVTFMLGPNLMFRYMKRGGAIYAVQITLEGNYLRYVLFKLDTENGELHHYELPERPLDDTNFRLFVQLLIFTELSELETVIIKPRQSHGTRRQGKYKNESVGDVVLVDSTWNKILVREDGFTVSGHLRLQPYGPGKTRKKLIFIEEFQKSGYVRGAKGGVEKVEEQSIETTN